MCTSRGTVANLRGLSQGRLKCTWLTADGSGGRAISSSSSSSSRSSAGGRSTSTTNKNLASAAATTALPSTAADVRSPAPKRAGKKGEALRRAREINRLSSAKWG